MIDHHLCKTTVSWFPPWPCPACKQGTLQNLKAGENPFRHWPNTGYIHGIDEGAVDRSEVSGVFSATLRCSSYQCQQGVSMLGDYSTTLVSFQPWEIAWTYKIRDVHPAILLIDVPDATPRPIKTAVNSSFALYWRDPEASAGKLRTALERIVDHLGPPKKPGARFVSLGARLARLRVEHPDLFEAADVLRQVGNDGAHGDAIDRERLLAAYELFEIELRRLFVDDTARRQVLIAKLQPPKAAGSS